MGVSSFHHVGPGNQSQDSSLGSKHINPLNYLPSSGFSMRVQMDQTQVLTPVRQGSCLPCLLPYPRTYNLLNLTHRMAQKWAGIHRRHVWYHWEHSVCAIFHSQSDSLCSPRETCLQLLRGGEQCFWGDWGRRCWAKQESQGNFTEKRPESPLGDSRTKREHLCYFKLQSLWLFIELT